MALVVTIVVSAALAILLAPAVRKVPAAWYVGAIVVCVVSAYLTLHPVPPQIIRTLVFVVQKCYVAFGLFAVVMFVGALPKDSSLCRRVMPARAELSIVATLLSGGHIVLYTMNYLKVGSSLWTTPSIVVPFAMSIIATVVLIVLFVTSFKGVRTSMPFDRWKFIQRFAYLFFVLIFVHALLFLGQSAMHGSQHSLFNLAVYCVVVVVYIVARVSRYAIDKRQEQAAA